MTDVATTPATSTLAPRQDAPLPAPIDQGAMLAAIVQMASDPRVDVAKLGALLEMQERQERRQAEIEFSRALGRIASIMPRVPKNGVISLGGKGNIPFSRWEDMDAVIRPLLNAEGFTLSFNSEPRPDGGGMIVHGTLLHRDGYSRTVSMPLAIDTGPGRNSLQAMGSTLSYGKRYCTEMLLNIVRAGDDDDGVRGGMKFVTDVQADELLQLLTLTKTEESRFLQMMVSGCHSVNEVEERDFIRLKNALLQKRAQQTAKATGEPA